MRSCEKNNLGRTREDRQCNRNRCHYLTWQSIRRDEWNGGGDVPLCAAAGPAGSGVVADSKTIHQVYDARHRCFGENYVQELVEKAPQIANHLDRVVGNLGPKRLKVLIQVNTSGEEFE
ncbi:hypothetical protein GH714_000748 [Hevea brasiliensis]|uniref:Uncharacterized protein n=1 Tax=Hevea brasiliensis TaxID=3981 RepID=A0A6A6LVF6_HEVBR|nr:hypothetical protein GH714_000748 [Hevea brasiliensis]